MRITRPVSASKAGDAVAVAPRYRWVILGVCWLAYIVAFMQRLSIGPLAPFLKESLGLTSTQTGLFMSAAAFGYTLTLIPAGWLADRIGVRWLLLFGEIVGGIFVGGMFFLTSFTQGLVLMALAGLGMGCLMPSTTKAILEWFPVKERATAMGLKQTALNIGGIITAITLPAIALGIGWKYGFLGIGIIAIAVGLISFALYRKPPESLVPVQAVSQGGAAASPTKGAAIRDAFRNRDIWLLTGTSLCLAVVEFASVAYFVLYMKESLLASVVSAGYLLAVLEAGGAFGKPLSGVISDRMLNGSRKKVYLMMCLLALISSLAFVFVPPNVSFWVIAPLCLVLGFGGIGWGGLHLTLISEFAGRESAGTVTGICSVLLMVGTMTGPPVFGFIVDSTGSYRLAWIFLAVMSLLATGLLSFVRENRRKV